MNIGVVPVKLTNPTSDLDIRFTCSFLISKTAYQQNLDLRKSLEKALKKVGKAHYRFAREVNTFMVAHGWISTEAASSVNVQDNLEAELRKIHEKYVKKVAKSVRASVLQDTEVSESRKALERAHKFHRSHYQSRVRQQIAGIEKVVIQNLKEVISSTRLFLWEDFSTGACRLVTWNNIFSDVYEGLQPGEFGGLTDGLTLLVFSQRFIRLLQPLIANLLGIIQSFELTIENIAIDLSGPSLSESHRESIAECIRVLLGKLLGIRETFRSSSRQVWRFTALAKEMEDRDSAIQKKVLQQMTDEFLDVEAIAQIGNSIGQLNSLISDLIPKIRYLVELVERREITGSFSVSAEHRHLTFIGDCYSELEKLRFWTDLWEDIPYFTLMPGGIAFEAKKPSGISKYGAFTKELLGLFGLRKEVPVDTSIPEDVVLKGTDLFKTYRLANSTIYALRGVSLAVNRGEFVAITGPSGSGKTTLLNILSGLDNADRGSVFIDRMDISKMGDNELTELRRDKLGFIFQYYNLLPVLTSNENVALPAQLGGDHPKGKALQVRVDELMKDVQLEQFGKQIPIKLSGGQMQRVTIARSMTNKPDILFADEPTGDLDSVTGAEIMKLISRFHAEGSSVVLVTHDHEIAMCAERIIELRDGQIVKDVKPA